MATTITLANIKGGVGKTTAAINLACALSFLEYKVLLVDYDPQGNATIGIGFAMDKPLPFQAATLTENPDDIVHCITKTTWGFDVIPTDLDLSSYDYKMINMLNRELVLKTALSKITNLYDFIIIDTNPSLGLLTTNALAAADYIFVPIQTDKFSIRGLHYLMEHTNRLSNHLNKKTYIGGAFLSRFEGGTSIAKNYESTLRENTYFLMKTVIRKNVDLQESIDVGKPIFFHKLKSRGAEDFLDLVKEVLDIVSA